MARAANGCRLTTSSSTLNGHGYRQLCRAVKSRPWSGLLRWTVSSVCSCLYSAFRFHRRRNDELFTIRQPAERNRARENQLQAGNRIVNRKYFANSDIVDKSRECHSAETLYRKNISDFSIDTNVTSTFVSIEIIRMNINIFCTY